MDKVTKVNIEGHNYELLAGGAVEGSSSSQSADWTKILVLPEGASITDGMFLAITFTYGNTAGFEAPKTVYSDDGENFYWDDQLTDAVTLPDPRNYTVTLVSGEEYSLIEYPVLYYQNQVFPVCDAKGHIRGGDLWEDGDTAVLLFVDNKFFVMSVSGGNMVIPVYDTQAQAEADLANLSVGQTIEVKEGTDGVIDAVVDGDMRAITSNAVANANGWSTVEQKVGTFFDGTTKRNRYRKMIIANIPSNGSYAIATGITNLRNIVSWRGNFFQGSFANPTWIMHVPYTYINTSNTSEVINIYVYYNPTYNDFEASLVGSGQYASGYFNGQIVFFVEYTKNE